MEKSDYVWVGIRIFGIFLLIQAVLALPNLFTSSLEIYTNWIKVPDTTDPLNTMRSYLFSTGLNALVGAITRVLIYGLVGLYLTRSGRILFRWIFPPAVPRS